MIGVGLSLGPVAVSGTSAVTGLAVNTQGYIGNGMLWAAVNTKAGEANTLNFYLTEAVTSGATYTVATDNTGATIGFTLVVGSNSQYTGAARIEGLGLQRKQYLKANVTPSANNASSSTFTAVIALGENQINPSVRGETVTSGNT